MGMSRWANADAGSFGVPLVARTRAWPTEIVGTRIARSVTGVVPAPDSSVTVPAPGSTASPRPARVEAVTRTTVAATVVQVRRFRPVRGIFSVRGEVRLGAFTRR